jgi:hypothetical protein
MTDLKSAIDLLKSAPGDYSAAIDALERWPAALRRMERTANALKQYFADVDHIAEQFDTDSAGLRLTH